MWIASAFIHSCPIFSLRFSSFLDVIHIHSPQTFQHSCVTFPNEPNDSVNFYSFHPLYNYYVPQVFDGIVIIISFTIDLVFIEGVTSFAVDEFVIILTFLLPWRILRVLNSKRFANCLSFADAFDQAIISSSPSRHCLPSCRLVQRTC